MQNLVSIVDISRFDALWFENGGTHRKPNTSTFGDNDWTLFYL